MPATGLDGELEFCRLAAGLLGIRVDEGIPAAALVEIDSLRRDVSRHEHVVDLAALLAGLDVLYQLTPRSGT